MSDNYESYEILFAVYPTDDGAQRAIDVVKGMQKTKAMAVIDAVTLVKHVDGEVSVKQQSLPSVKKGLGIGALIGGAVALVFPPSLLAGAAIGAGIGAGAAKIAKSAAEDPELKKAAESLDPGNSAAIVIVDGRWTPQIREAMAGYNKLAEHPLDPEAAGVLGIVKSESEEVIYGQAVTDDAASEFVVAATDNMVAGEATTAAIGEDGTVVVDRVAGAAAVDEEGNVGAIRDEVVMAADAEGNVAVGEQAVAGFAPAAGEEAITEGDKTEA